VIIITQEGEKLHKEASDFIKKIYLTAFGAYANNIMPKLLICKHDKLIDATLGFRGGEEEMFLERYLDTPIEQAIHEKEGCAMERDDIAELGNLAVAKSGALREIIPIVIDVLRCEGYSWVTFTGGRLVLNSFKRLGIKPTPLVPADRGRLPDEDQERWGSYYQDDPWVYYVKIPPQ